MGIPDGTQSIESCKVLALVLFQVGPQVMLEATTITKLAHPGRKFGAEGPRDTETLFILGLAETAVSILTLRLLLFIFLFIATFGMRRGFSSIVDVRIVCRLGLGRNQKSDNWLS